MRCPGQDSRNWQPGAIFEARCPNCGADVEFFKDESARRCRKCGHKCVNPKMDFGCAAYCKYAPQCLGDLPPELLAQRESLLKDRVALEMKKYFQKDFKRIGHAVRVAQIAEKIVVQEQGDPAVVLMAAYLHHLGTPEGEGTPMARDILSRLGAREDLVDEVCDIIGHHHPPRREERINFKCLHDAKLLANLEEEEKERPLAKEKLQLIISKDFLTEWGRKLATELLLG